MRHRTYILIVVLAALSSLAAHADAVDVKHYAAMRKSATSGIDLDLVRSNPVSCAGQIVEIRGRLAGMFKKKEDGRSGNAILSAKAGSFVLAMDRLPAESPGVDMACIVKVSQSGELEVQAWTYDAELRRYEESLRPRAAPKQKVDEVRKIITEPSRGAKTYTLTAEQIVQAYKRAVKQFNSRLSDSQADTIARSILGFSYKYKVDARLVCAVILAESHFKIGATSRCGAMGLGQLMPTTAAGLGVNNAYDPIENIYGSTRYIKGVLDRVSGNKHWNELTWNDLALGLAAYNAGPGAVKKHGGIPPYRETQAYVKRVTSIYKRLCGLG